MTTEPRPHSTARIANDTPTAKLRAAFLSAFAVALVAFGSSVLALFVANGQNPSIFGQAVLYFTAPALVLLVLLTAVNRIGALRSAFTAVLAGVGAAILAAFLGGAVSALAVGARADQVWVFALSSIVNLGPVFIAASAVAEALLAPRVYNRSLQRVSRGARRLALVRIPASNLDEAELTHLERSPIDSERADRQWDNYCAALAAEGWDVLEVDGAPELADSVFVEDTVVFFGDVAVITRPGAESRRPEIDGTERLVRSLPGIRIERIEAPGTLEGGDVLKVGDTVYVGASSRTNAEGIRQLRVLLEGSGCDVVAVPVSRVLHLKSAVTALPDGTIIGHPDLIVDTSLFPRFLPMPEREGVAVVELDRDRLLMSASAPASAALLANLGYRVVTVDISEFEKLEGCVTCLSVRVR
ncbi:dimethylargininase [Agromyces atrinae]|uniref:Dimethylargininase n=1 Tax=Agromyces atrinae TaxID=592376 RepID=A0A4Q2MED2_9MICO|nr:dimethylargininase [Agromyces atrinae]NYD66796.1 dimethylargininase [Agromyces atrinae]RXZ87450.1 dimethylarginine dimethylaminohydrolase [Agromyces atrinae]